MAVSPLLDASSPIIPPTGSSASSSFAPSLSYSSFDRELSGIYLDLRFFCGHPRTKLFLPQYSSQLA